MATQTPTAATLAPALRDAATEARLAEGTILTYERHWRALATFCTRQHLELAALDEERAETLYRLQTDGRSPSHHLGAKAAFAFAFRHLRLPNPFAHCAAPAFAPDKVEISYLDAGSLGRLFATLRERQKNYFDRLNWVLTCGLYHTAARFHEWAFLSTDSLIQGPHGWPVTARFRIKGGRYRDLPLAEPMGRELQRWLLQLEVYRGIRLRQHNLEFAASRLVFPGRGGGPVSNQFFNARLKAACVNAGVRVISAHGLRHSAATLLLNDTQHSLREVQELLGHRQLATTARYTHVASQQLRRAVEALGVPGSTTDSGPGRGGVA